MNPEDIFDSSGGHKSAWDRLPASIKVAIEVYQQMLQREVDKRNPGRFRPTSGFRSDTGNRRCGGVVDSLHLWGSARDFVPVDPSFRAPPSVCASLFIVRRSPVDGPFKCWHVEVK